MQDNHPETFTFSHPVPRHPAFAMRRVMAKKHRQRVFEAYCMICESDQRFSTRSANCFNCTEKPRIAARLLGEATYKDDCSIHGIVKFSTHRGLCLDCYNSNGTKRPTIEIKTAQDRKPRSNRAMARHYGLAVFIESCDRHGGAEHSVAHGKCLSCYTTGGIARNLPENAHERPLAVGALFSYRIKGPFGYIMIGAKDDDDAMNEARRSSDKVNRNDLEIWDTQRRAYRSIYDHDPL